MSFLYSPTLLRTPTIPGMNIARGVWVGQGVDAGLISFSTGVSSLGNYVITKNLLAYQIKVSNSIYSPVFNDVNGYIYWISGSNYIYYTPKYGWVLHNRFPGCEPKEEYNSKDKQYEGDAFHAGSLPGISDGATSSFQPRGTNRNGGGSSITLTFWFPRWQSVKNTRFGEFDPKSGESDKKYLGTPRWRDNSYVEYPRGLKKQNGKFVYGDIRYENGKWLLGNLNNPSGWWEGAEPSKTSSVTFRFCKPEGSEITGSNKTVSFVDYVVGEEKLPAYLGEVAIWR